jgi:ADP-ribose pyrophosphatase YjhB (NUDIX family)
MVESEPKWIDWAKRLQAIAQNGLTYTENHFDVERYQAVQQVAAEMIAEGSGKELQQVLDLLSGEEGYATPKVDVRGIVFRDDELLLVKEWSDKRWTPPGGWADVSESPRESVVREVYEESGFRTRVVKLLAVYDRSKHPHYPPFIHHVYKMFFLCEITGGTAQPSAETLDVGFFPRHEIPDLSISRVTPLQIERFFEHHEHPEWPTDLD